MKVARRILGWARKSAVTLVLSLMYPVALLIDQLILGGGVNKKGINERVVFVLFAAPVVVFVGTMLFFALIRPLFQRK